MKEHSLFRQPRKLAAVTFLTAFYVAQVYVSTWYFSYVCDAVMDSTNLPSKMIRMVVIYFAMQGCLLVVKYGYDAACIRIRESMLAGLRRTLLGSVIGQLEIEEYEQIGGSRIAGVLTNDVKALGKQVIVPQMEIVKALLRLAAFNLLLFTYSGYIGAMSVGTSILIFLSSLLANKIVVAPGKVLAQAQERYLREYKQWLDCRTDFKYAGQDCFLKKKMVDCNDYAEQAQYRLRNSKTLVLFIHFLTRNAAWCLILAAELVLASKGHFSAGQILATISVFSMIQDDLSSLQLSFESLSEAAGVCGRIEELAEGIHPAAGSVGEAGPDWACFGVKNLSFGYGSAIISDADATFRRGEKYVLTGPSGAGKSSLVKILLGLQANYSGKVFLDGVTLPRGSKAISERAAYLGQDFHLFQDTVEANLYFGEEVRKRRLEASPLYRLVRERLPDVREVLRENGANLSGGQRQLVGIARAIAQGKDVLILDESLSAADPQLFERILSQLKGTQGLTLLFISHRIQENHGFDHILELKEGKICETHQRGCPDAGLS